MNTELKIELIVKWKKSKFMSKTASEIPKIKKELKDILNNQFSKLEIFKLVFLDPIQKNKFMTQEEYDFCFKNMEQVFLIYQKIKNELEEVGDNYEASIIDIFQNNLPSLKIQILLIPSLEEIVLKLEKIIEKNKKFRNFLENIEKEDIPDFPYNNIRNSRELMIISGGRGIPRYSLLFRDLLKYDVENEKFKTIISDLESLGNDINQALKESEKKIKEIKKEYSKETSICLIN